jgi:hypothetical protein
MNGVYRTQADLKSIIPAIQTALTYIGDDTKAASLYGRLLECRCFVMSRTHEYDSAIVDGTRAVKIAPTSWLAYDSMARSMIGLNQPVDARKLIRKAIHDAQPYLTQGTDKDQARVNRLMKTMQATLKVANDAAGDDGKGESIDDDNDADEDVLVKSMDGYPSTPHFPFSPSVIHSPLSCSITRQTFDRRIHL